MRKGKLKKALALALTGAVIIGAFAGCGAKKDSSSDTKKEETKKIVIGASPSPHADILKVAKKELKKEGIQEGEIKGTIKMSKKFNVSKDDTMKNIINEFSLTKDKAQEYIEKLWFLGNISYK